MGVLFILAVIFLIVATDPLRGVMLKPGVNARGLKPEALLAVGEARAVFERRGYDFVITDIEGPAEGRLEDSLHDLGLAFDVRIRHLPGFTEDSPGTFAFSIASEIRSALGAQYDVVLKPNHIHIEFDPKP